MTDTITKFKLNKIKESLKFQNFSSFRFENV